MHREPSEKFIGAFSKPPLYSVAYDKGFGTLYTAVYYPRLGKLDLRWPGSLWSHSIDRFSDAVRYVHTPDLQEPAQ